MYIEGPDGVLADTLAEGAEMTALEALQAVCEAEDVALEVSGAGMFAYVKAIGGCREFDSGPLSGWIFKVNGVHSAKGVGSVTVKAGDRVSFYYSLDMGQDVKDKP